MDFQETSEDAVRREIQEELGSEIENLERLDVIENFFVHDGEDRHDIVFLFKADLSRKELYGQKSIHVEETNYEFDTVWVPVSRILAGEVPLYPKLDWSRFLS